MPGFAILLDYRITSDTSMSIEPSSPNRPNNGKAFAGLILLGIGGILLLKQFELFYFPRWIFSFPMLLIAIGMYVGVKHNFRNATWLILVLIGGIFLLDKIFDDLDVRQFFWPIILIGMGLWFILKKDHKFSLKNKANFDKPYMGKEDPFAKGPIVDYTVNEDGTTASSSSTFGASSSSASSSQYGDNYVDATSVFGSFKKIVLSKDFKGGDIINVFGGCELDFSQADINGRVIIDVTQLFGGIKMIVPPHWQIQSDIAAIFAGVDDKRLSRAVPLSPDKILVLTGTSIFAGVDIRSF
jgi:predicted membrane protein